MGALDAWVSRVNREEEMPSGATVTYFLPSVRDMILAGDFPAPILAVARQFESGKLDLNKTMSDEELEHWAEFRNRVIAKMVVKVEGEDVELTHEDVGKLPPDDAEALFARALRLVNAPKAKV